MSRHVNVAQLIGATEGWKGLNGIVVAMGKPDLTWLALFSNCLDGINVEEFVRRTHSGAVWAKFVRESLCFDYTKY